MLPEVPSAQLGLGVTGDLIGLRWPPWPAISRTQAHEAQESRDAGYLAARDRAKVRAWKRLGQHRSQTVQTPQEALTGKRTRNYIDEKLQEERVEQCRKLSYSVRNVVMTFEFLALIHISDELSHGLSAAYNAPRHSGHAYSTLGGFF